MSGGLYQGNSNQNCYSLSLALATVCGGASGPTVSPKSAQIANVTQGESPQGGGTAQLGFADLIQLEAKLGTDTALENGGDQFGDSG